MDKTFTSVKIDREIYEKFKILSVSRKIHLQDFVNKTLHKFIADESFRNEIYSYQIPFLSTDIVPPSLTAQNGSI